MKLWVRVTAGAVGIFGVGMLLVSGGRRLTAQVHEWVHTNRAIEIPLAFLPYRLGGIRMGALKRLEVLRDAPNRVNGVRVTVRLADSASAPEAGCRLTLDDPERIDAHSSFRCVTEADSALQLRPFGSVRFEPAGTVRPLFLPAQAIADLRDTTVAAALAVPDAPSPPAADSPDFPRGPHVQLSADSTRAFLEMSDGHPGGALVRLAADGQGVALRIRDDSGREVVRLVADSNHADLHVKGK